MIRESHYLAAEVLRQFTDQNYHSSDAADK